MELYVRSEKVGHFEFTMPHQAGGGHWCSAGYRSKGTEKIFTEEENEAIECLSQNGVAFDVVDLSESSMKKKLVARAHGINRTPTLVLENGEKLTGLDQIRRYLRSGNQ